MPKTTTIKAQDEVSLQQKVSPGPCPPLWEGRVLLMAQAFSHHRVLKLLFCFQVWPGLFHGKETVTCHQSNGPAGRNPTGKAGLFGGHALGVPNRQLSELGDAVWHSRKPHIASVQLVLLGTDLNIKDTARVNPADLTNIFLLQILLELLLLQNFLSDVLSHVSI